MSNFSSLQPETEGAPAFRRLLQRHHLFSKMRLRPDMAEYNFPIAITLRSLEKQIRSHPRYPEYLALKAEAQKSKENTCQQTQQQKPLLSMVQAR